MGSENSTYGFVELAGNLEKLGAKLFEQLKFATAASALNIETTAKMDCPVDMGTLRSSIHQEDLSEGKTIRYWIGSNVYYAPFVEFGTGARVSIPTGYDEFAAQFKGQKDVAGMNAQPYLLPNFEMEKEKFKQNILNILENAKP
jgi:HK97 gp10 family phage protein